MTRNNPKKAEDSRDMSSRHVPYMQGMMKQSQKKFGAIMEEEHQFCEMFGVGAQVAKTCWNMLLTLFYLPKGGLLTHFLWTLCFIKVYPKQGPLCMLCGNADHKTVHKWVWLFIEAIANLESHLVSQCIFLVDCCHCRSLTNPSLLPLDYLGE